MKVKWKGKTEFLVLTHNKIYEVISIERGWYRIVDDSGEDYLYSPKYFETIEN
jgi:tRNA A22 N-methylase